jgi:predicted lipoprotein with Yx(FWY)xxD motif
MTGRRRAPRKAWYRRLPGKRPGLALAVAAVAAVAVAAAVALTVPGVVFARATSSAADSGAPRPSISANHAYAAPAAPSSAQLPPGGLVPAHHGQPTPIQPATASTLPSGVPTDVPAGSAPPSLTVEAATSQVYGLVLVTPAGMTLYRQSGICDCDGQYQPLLTQPGQPLLLPPLLHGQLGSMARPDGTLQVTFDHWPLYLYTGDLTPGDANGVNLAWQVINPAS